MISTTSLKDVFMLRNRGEVRHLESEGNRRVVHLPGQSPLGAVDTSDLR